MQWGRPLSGPVRDNPPYRAIPFRDSIAERGIAPICLVFIGNRASIAEIPLLRGGGFHFACSPRRKRSEKGEGVSHPIGHVDTKNPMANNRGVSLRQSRGIAQYGATKGVPWARLNRRNPKGDGRKGTGPECTKIAHRRSLAIFTADKGIARNSATRTIFTHFLCRRNRGSLAIFFAEEIAHLEASKNHAMFWGAVKIAAAAAENRVILAHSGRDRKCHKLS